MSGSPFAPHHSASHQQPSPPPLWPQSWSWDGVPGDPFAPSTAPQHQHDGHHLTLPPMHMQHDLDSAIDSAEQPASTGLQNSRSNFLADILNEGDDAPGTRRTATASSSRDPHPPYALARPQQPPPSHPGQHLQHQSQMPSPQPSRHHGYVDVTRERSPPISQERSTLRTLHHEQPPAEEDYLFLTNLSTPTGSDSSSAMPPSRRPKRENTGSPLSAGPSTKRAKRDDGSSNSTNGRRRSGQHLDASTSSAGNAAADEVEEIEQIDLIDDDTPLATALQKQRAEQVKAQQESQTGADAPPRLTSLTCVICMDTPKDLTATACGHVFCHACLMEALIAGEARAGPGEPKRSQCPVCRKALSRNKTGDIIPLLLMKKGLATQPRR
ncbi:hypothetical protein SLS56_007017 [Neofusicoccum ribis]|uniref:RING-type domain-containing protein n=1 Tax=Neofusicoccum ribis TaxID=45134 RepID=A0ABR3SP73_9PEZI